MSAEKVNDKIPLVRLYIKTVEDIMLNLVELENTFKDLVANPG